MLFVISLVYARKPKIYFMIDYLARSLRTTLYSINNAKDTPKIWGVFCYVKNYFSEILHK